MICSVYKLNKMDALLAAPMFSSIFFQFFLFLSILLYTSNPIAVKKRTICSVCSLRDDVEQKNQPISEAIVHLILQSRENGWRQRIFYLSVMAAGQNLSTTNLSSDDLNQHIKEKTVLSVSCIYLYNNLVPSVCLSVCMYVCMSVCPYVMAT